MSDNNSGGFLLILVLAGFFASWHYDYSPFGSEVYIYQQYRQCEDEKKLLKCNWFNNNKRTYKVNFDMQTVVTLDLSGSITKAQDCAVIDKNNWSCGTAYYKYGFSDGDYTGEDSEQYRYVSKTNGGWLNYLAQQK